MGRGLVEGELQVESGGERFTCGGGDQQIDGARLQLKLGIFPEVTDVRWFERRWRATAEGICPAGGAKVCMCVCVLRVCVGFI